jgi:hypothetical protein
MKGTPLNRIKLILASTVIAAFFAVPAAASAAPVNLTQWDPARINNDAAGKWQSVAVNPTNGNQLVAFRQVDGTAKYSAGVWTSSGAPAAFGVDLASGAATYTYSTPVGAYNPKTGGWMVVYYDYDIAEYKAQLLSANGALSGSAQVISAAPDLSCCTNPDIAWDSAKQQFFVAWADYVNGGVTGAPQGRFVNPSTGAPVGAAPIDLVTNASDFVWDDYHSMQVAYSSKQDGFGVMFRGQLVAGGEWRPYFLRLNANGQPIGTPQVISSGSDLEITNGSITYSKASNRYAVAWSDYSEDPAPTLVQLFNAATGSEVGTPVAQPLPVSATNTGGRIQISADEYGSGYALTSWITNNAVERTAIYALWLDSAAQPVGTPDWVSTGLGGAVRPQIAFDRHSGCFRVTYIAEDSLSTSDTNIYSSEIGTSGLEGCSSPPPSGKKKPALKKSGNAGSTSLRVKVGCGGASACRVKLSGKLQGGSGKLQGKTVKVKAGKKKTVTLAYTSALISELSGRSGSKIRVTAKLVGGKARTITVAVPDSVTG